MVFPRPLFLLLLAVAAAAGPSACSDPGDAADAPDVPADLPADVEADLPDAVAPGLFRAVFFAVGTADSILIQSPEGRTLLVDLGIPQVVADGREADTARRVTSRIEALTGRKAVDYFLASHFHSDHVGIFRRDGTPIGGIAYAVRSLGLRVGTLLDRGRSPAGNSDTQGDYLWWAEDQPGRIVLSAPASGIIDLGPQVRVDLVAAPGAGVAPDGSEENGFSLPLRITFGDLEIALAGDLTGDCNDIHDVETAVAPALGAVEVYKVNHHGSQSSSNLSWVRTLRPRVSVFPVGESRFGYPHDRTVVALSTAGTVFSTRDGDVVVESSDGRTFTVNGREFTARDDAAEAAETPPAVGLDEKTDALCRNGRDDDRDGYTDCSDWSCSRCPGVSACH